MGGRSSKGEYQRIDGDNGRKIKIVVTGESVGKTTLIRKFVSIGDKKLKNMIFGSKSTRAERVQPEWSNADLDIFECHGPKIRLLFSCVLRNADIIFKVYDLTDPSSSERVIRKNSRTIKWKAPGSKVFLVGNKAEVDVTDAIREVVDVREVESRHSIAGHMMVSAKTGYNVERLFCEAITEVFPLCINPNVNRSEPEPVQPVIRPKKIDRENHADVYRMDKPVKGLCLIINNKSFDKSDLPRNQCLQYREASELDAKRLRVLFEGLGFQVRQKDDLTDTEMLREVNIAAFVDDHTNYNCFICCILSHGSEKQEGSVYGSNCRDIAISSLTYPFQARNSPKLAGKPKLFFIQACQGEKKMQGQPVDVPDRPDVVPKTSEIIPDEADFLLMMSTCSGYVAVRNIINGSHFVNELVDAIREHSGCSMMDIATTVVDRVSKKDFGGYHQGTSTTDTGAPSYKICPISMFHKKRCYGYQNLEYMDDIDCLEHL